ncbi:hypothetical protein BJ742DRAFT_857139 [Cladochytrium replicatum]|nr:hypothetical protein BJ742DRAFT_857139 [Cladochytrium replicatum]
MKRSPHNPKSYRLYGSFLINVLNDKKTRMAMLQHAEELEDVSDVPEDAEGELNIIQLMSSDCTTVLEAKALMIKIFGFRKAELVDFNINKIIPHTVSDHHDSFLTNFLETGMAKVVDRLRHVLGVHKDGHLIMISLPVKQAGTEGGTSYLAFIKPLSLKSGEEEFIILDNGATATTVLTQDEIQYFPKAKWRLWREMTIFGQVRRPPKLLGERSPSYDPPIAMSERSPSFEPPRHQRSTDGFPRHQPFPHPFGSRDSSFLEIPNRHGLQVQPPMSPLALSNDNTPVVQAAIHATHRAGSRGSLGAASETTSATGRSASGHGYVKSVVYQKNAFAERRPFFLNSSFLLCYLLLQQLGPLTMNTTYSMQLGIVAEF